MQKGDYEENQASLSRRKREFIYQQVEQKYESFLPEWKRIMYHSFRMAKKKSEPWKDYRMNVFPYEKDKPIQYEFTACPVAEFALRFHLAEIMPALCNVDDTCMEMIHARLIRTSTCSNGEKCDYAIYGDKDEYNKNHPESISQDGDRRNE